MGSQSIAQWAEKEKEVSLYSIVNDVMRRSSMLTEQNGNIIINNVDLEIRILADTGKVRSILMRIMELILAVSHKSQIQISAKIYTDLVLVHFKEDNIQHIGHIYNEIKQMLPEVEQLGGFLGVTSHENKITTIAFTFLNARTPPLLYTDRLAHTLFQTSKRPRDKH